ncbi:two-component system, OmpR family, sensor histidine kinase MprB [Actinacidiphila yanglinensis]|uniref:histidine kinase n=1 Tax=Actinacidiphila yanglinensis TaxID=310779 RepID=A0A1H6DU41_9ACTN|nr:HAMP domain-containing sensor histidine kinase [Actinacidiphila yanglinensis]SEG88801.1 two-component system, OmpR family, sensor histidine kinase MprB [Actinacidiphila yanglinensis]
MNRLPLRSRLTILTAAAVLVAVALAALACWLITRNELNSQLDKSLSQGLADAKQQLQRASRLPGFSCESQALDNGQYNINPSNVSAQIVLPDGRTCLITGTKTFTTTQADREVATDPRQHSVTHTVHSNGTTLRVYTVNPDATISIGGQTQPIALSVARPLSVVTDPLTTLAWVLLAVTGIGAIGAASAGLLIAQAGLRPVDTLTQTVEHIARTEDLNVRIPVEGQDEIARLSASFNSMTAALASSRDRQQQLIADAGHELRTPLTSLRTNIELLERSEATGRAIPPDDRRALLASVKAQMTELAALIGDLQELSRPDTGPALQVVALHEVTETALRRARLRGPDLEISAHVAPWYVRSEAAGLERAIVNLMDNAVKFSPPGGEIEVRLRGGLLTVRDHGPGIPEEDLPHVFERFWRSPSARSLPGSGLGLAIVARTAQQAGGEVSLSPAPGGGTLAALRLPGAATAPPETPPDMPPTAPPPPAA